jgi:predicted YcjX-like family ATPase
LFSFLKDIELPFKIPMPDTTIRVAVTGLSRSGKTVFLTSMINQLLANDKLTYVNEKIKRPFVARLLPPDSVHSRFDYYNKLNNFRLKEPKWPTATKAISKTTVKLEMKSDYSLLENQVINLELVDYPGEWLLDLSMLGMSYEQWSNQMIRLANEPQRKKEAQDWLDYIKEVDVYSKNIDEINDEVVHDLYTEYLKSLHYKAYSFVQPGRFLEPGDMSGDPLLRFSPLPWSVNGNVHEDSIYARFEKRYNLYLEEVVKRMYFEYFESFDTQIILVDLVKTLQNGETCFNDMHLSFKNILKSFTYGSNNIFSKFFKLKIDHVIFAATKADYIPPSQHNSYKKLLETMIWDIKKELDVKHTNSEVTIISAVRSTEYVRAKLDGNIVECVKGVVDGEDRPSTHFTGILHGDYKDSEFWKKSEFNFPLFKPTQFPSSDRVAVDHIRMDRLLYSILKDRV